MPGAVLVPAPLGALPVDGDPLGEGPDDGPAGLADVGVVVTLDWGFELVVAGADVLGAEVACVGQGGSRLAPASSCSCLMASSRLPVGSPA